jgi:hypothetical protein
MLKPNKQVVHDIGEDAFERLARTRAGARHPADAPGWLEAAVILAHYFAPAPAWASSNSIIALIKQATVDCKRALERMDEDSDLKPELEELLGAFRTFFLHNGLAEPE